MRVDDRRYTALADEVLEHLCDTVDEVLGAQIDADLHAGILTLSLSGGGQYIINKHAPNREIWMSSPVGGATHFAYVDGQWVSTRDASVVLHVVLAAELNSRYGAAIAF